ncbi:disease resistance protein [Trifolium medium]|uniref:Disease resistance protein n=1 Tax=Trifolium medium TaxID=97028 RepID=A0A392N8X0_9FABA|nr:disease resistance protein [Trifolium medium]
MWNLQTIGFIGVDKRTTYLIEKGSFPKLRTLRLQISKKFKGDVPKMLSSLEQLKNLNELEIFIGWYPLWMLFDRKREEVNQSFEHLGRPSLLRMICPVNHGTHVPDRVIHVTVFPPNITKLTLVGIRHLNDDGMKAIGSLSKLQILILRGLFFDSSSGFDFNFVQDGFPQLQEFQMIDLPIRNWKLANGSMPSLQILIVHNCGMLDSLPSELWSLTTLGKVCVQKPSDAMAAMLQNLKVNNGCGLIVE